MTRPVDDLREFNFDYLCLKFANLPQPVLLPWIEVANGKFIPGESTEDEFVFEVVKEDQEPPEEFTPVDESSLVKRKVRTGKSALLVFLSAKLSEKVTPTDADYGAVEDLRIQPVGDMTKEVFRFLNSFPTKS